MISKAQKVMDQRLAMINQAREVLRVLEASTETVVHNTNNTITIAKGKVVEVVKEVVKVDEDKINQLTAELRHKDSIIKELEQKLAQLSNKSEANTNKEVRAEVKDNSINNTTDKELESLYAQLKEVEDKLKVATKPVQIKTLTSAANGFKRLIAQRKALLNNPNKIEVNVSDKYSKDLYGKATVDNKDYFFRATSNHTLPIVYGAMSMEVIEEVKRLIIMDRKANNQNFNFCSTVTDLDNVVYDFDNNIVVWKTKDGNFKGYTSDYIFAWDGVAKAPMRKLFKNALISGQNLWKPMTKSSTGSDRMEARGKAIINACLDLFSAESYDNEIEVDTTNNNNTTLVGADEIDM